MNPHKYFLALDGDGDEDLYAMGMFYERDGNTFTNGVSSAIAGCSFVDLGTRI